MNSKISKFSIFTTVLLTILLTPSCSSLRVSYDMDEDIDFTKYKTYSYYGWSHNSDRLLNDINKKKIEQAFAQELKSRGLTYVKEGGDMIVSLFIVIDQKTSKTAYTDHYGGGRYGYGRGWGYGYSETTVHEYDYAEGTLICDVLDAEKEKLAWQGIGTSVIEENIKKRDYRIKEAAKKIMAKFPIAPIKQ